MAKKKFKFDKKKYKAISLIIAVLLLWLPIPFVGHAVQMGIASVIMLINIIMELM